jgi:hypothetical protein
MGCGAWVDGWHVDETNIETVQMERRVNNVDDDDDNDDADDDDNNNNSINLISHY